MGTMLAFFATPWAAPATVPATWVPCPWQSELPSPGSPVPFHPDVTLPPKSEWVPLVPVSTTYAVTPVPSESYE